MSEQERASRDQAMMPAGFAAAGLILNDVDKAFDKVKRGAGLAICSVLLGAAVSLAPDGQPSHYPQPLVPTPREVVPTYYGNWSYRDPDSLLEKTTS